ncbi:MAG: NAD(P)-dependent oxidoreductase, partial [Deltaproteobacteria bacterium]|nr:NAD(P)-dependent oxidoreductase [Deltaproteobacteria bacterium]
KHSPPETEYHRVLITGAAGVIGSVLRRELRGRFSVLRLSDIRDLGPAGPGEEVALADIQDYKAMLKLMQGVDAVVHLGGSADGREWDTILRLNIVGGRNVFEAARQQGVKRVVFASSNHAMGLYSYEGFFSPDLPARPDTYYGLSKAFSEDLLRYYWDKYGMESVSVRIGSFQPHPQDVRQLSTWLSHRDAVELFYRALVQPNVGALIVLGFSANSTLPICDPNAARIGWVPKDNGEDYREALRAKGQDVDGPRPFKLLGGPYTLPDFDIP